MVAFLWLFNLISPITSIIGALVLCSGEFEGAEPIFGAVLAVVGFILGLTSWSETVPPRWFWVKSKLDLFDNKVWNSLSMALQFFLIPFAVAGIRMIIGAI